jgi:hypothetical protein
MNYGKITKQTQTALGVRGFPAGLGEFVDCQKSDSRPRFCRKALNAQAMHENRGSWEKVAADVRTTGRIAIRTYTRLSRWARGM